jgi:DNA-binding Lrp family transcriptional regulator
MRLCQLAARLQIMECDMVAGGFDYLLKTRVRDMAAYRDFCRYRVVATA